MTTTEYINKLCRIYQDNFANERYTSGNSIDDIVDNIAEKVRDEDKQQEIISKFEKALKHNASVGGASSLALEDKEQNYKDRCRIIDHRIMNIQRRLDIQNDAIKTREKYELEKQQKKIDSANYEAELVRKRRDEKHGAYFIEAVRSFLTADEMAEELGITKQEVATFINDISKSNSDLREAVKAYNKAKKERQAKEALKKKNVC